MFFVFVYLIKFNFLQLNFHQFSFAKVKDDCLFLIMYIKVMDTQLSNSGIMVLMFCNNAWTKLSSVIPLLFRWRDQLK